MSCSFVISKDRRFDRAAPAENQ